MLGSKTFARGLWSRCVWLVPQAHLWWGDKQTDRHICICCCECCDKSTHERQKIETLKNKVLKFSESLIKQGQKRSKFDTRRFLKEHRSILRRNSMSGASFEAKIWKLESSTYLQQTRELEKWASETYLTTTASLTTCLCSFKNLLVPQED